MMAGYAFVDTLVADGIDLFALGSSKHLLELNTLVLCGTERGPPRGLRASHRGHRPRASTRSGAAGSGTWSSGTPGTRRSPPWSRAAGAYVRILSKPQLFIEGNHRTGALLMSYILVRDDEPPFVLSPENARAYFDPSTLIRDTEKNGPATLLRLSGVRKRLAALLREHGDPRHLLR